MTTQPRASKPERAVELAANLAALRARIAAAELAAGRPGGAVQLVAVTKTWPTPDIELLIELGVDQVGENREQEAHPKWLELHERHPHVVWHMIGQLQTNKAAAVARWADVVHSVDRARLVGALELGAGEVGRTIQVLLQLDLSEAAGERTDAAGSAPSPAAGRGGVRPGELAPLAKAVLAAEQLQLGGVMAVAPLGVDPDQAFAELARCSADVIALSPSATKISAGMSGDLEAAVRHGATHVRVGSALLGHRPPLR